MNEAVSKVRKETGGRILSAQDEGDGYRIKVLTSNGEVLVLHVDSKTGRIR